MQCEYKETEKASLKEHVESKHQGVSLACEYKAIEKIQSKGTCRMKTSWSKFRL